MLELLHSNRISVGSRKTPVDLALSHNLLVSVYDVVLSSLFPQLLFSWTCGVEEDGSGAQSPSHAPGSDSSQWPVRP